MEVDEIHTSTEAHKLQFRNRSKFNHVMSLARHPHYVARRIILLGDTVVCVAASGDVQFIDRARR